MRDSHPLHAALLPFTIVLSANMTEDGNVCLIRDSEHVIVQEHIFRGNGYGGYFPLRVDEICIEHLAHEREREHAHGINVNGFQLHAAPVVGVLSYPSQNPPT